MLTVTCRPQSSSEWQEEQSDRSSLPDTQGFLAASLSLSTVVGTGWLVKFRYLHYYTDVIAVSLLNEVHLVLSILSRNITDEMTEWSEPPGFSVQNDTDWITAALQTDKVSLEIKWDFLSTYFGYLRVGFFVLKRFRSEMELLCRNSGFFYWKI